jgi:DNA topoisomerase-2
MNGLGVKLTNIHSDYLKIVTIDSTKKKKYSQIYEKGFDIIHDPKIEPYTKPSFTLIKFIPTYSRFGYAIPLSNADYKELVDILRYDLVHMSCFLGSKVSILLNNIKIEMNSAIDLMTLLVNSDNIYHTKVKHENFYLEYCVYVGTHSSKLPTAQKVQSIGIINGCIVKGGTHDTVLRRKINAAIKLIKGERTIDILSYITTITIASLPVDNWGTQNKDVLSVKEDIFKPFTIPELFIKKISKNILDVVKYSDTKKKICKKVDKKILYDKYVAPKTKVSSTLFIVEGDSAMQLLIKFLNHKTSRYTNDNTGLFSLGGVPQNISKHLDDMKNESGVIEEVVDTKFLESKVFGALISIMKLDTTMEYSDVTSVKLLPFNKVVICVDQDVDGIGNICCLVLHMFYKLWPNLFKYNYIYNWNSPIIRILSNGKIVQELKYETQFKNITVRKQDEVQYIKGLAGHDDRHVPHLVQKFEADLVNFTVNERSAEVFNIYFGNDSSTRKLELSTPHEDFTIEEIETIERNRSITCNRHLSGHTKLFMLKAIERTIPAFDGMTPVRRKAYATFLRNRNEKFKKVFQWTGKIADVMLYHHGSTSMDQAIIKMAQKYLGSNYFPLCTGDGQFGSRNKKGKDAGSPRYISVMLNRSIADTLFLRNDLDILPRTYEDGIEVEPRYYLPILPLCILETRKAVTYGWQCKVYARDLNSVVSLLVKLIKGRPITEEEKKIPPSTYGYTGEIKLDGQCIIAKGKYINIPAQNKIIITELPLFINPSKYIESFVDNSNVANIRNYTDVNIEIHMDMVPGYMSRIEDLDTFLRITQSFKEELNFINPLGIIQHFDNVYDILLSTFNMNKAKYVERAHRDSILLRYRILREENILKFLQSIQKDKSTITKFYGEEEDIIDTILDTDGYERINSAAINTSSNYTTDQLEIELERSKEFSYIKQITVGQSSRKNIDARIEKLSELKKQLELLQLKALDKPFPYASTYKTEIEVAYNALRTYI